MTDLKRVFTVVLLLTLVTKLVIAYTLPFTTDEAYFYIWGLKFEWGYYDHPPMVGWILGLLEHISDAPVLMRLPSVLLTTFIGWAIYKVVARKNEEMGLLAGMLYLLMPINVYGVLISTDTSLIFFMFVSVLAFHRAVEEDSKKWFVLAGVFLGLAVLSKYFSALLGFAYLIYILLYMRNLRGFINLFIVYVVVLPFLAINLAWNYDHCWTNYLFNFVNRNTGAGFSLKTFALYLIMWVYLLVPPVLYYLWKKRQSLQALSQTSARVFLVAFFVPILLFLGLSFFKVIGLHWVLGFYPFIFILMGLTLERSQLLTSMKVVVVFTVLHLILIGTVIATPLSFVKPGDRYYDKVVIGVYPDEFLARLAPYREDYPTIATISYGDAAVLTYFAKQNVSVIGMGSDHARHDDIETDYRKLDGQNILVYADKKTQLNGLERVFQSVQYQKIELRGGDYYLMLGQGFDYAKYRSLYLEKIKRYYQIPSLLPTGKCYFYDRYFPGEAY